MVDVTAVHDELPAAMSGTCRVEIPAMSKFKDLLDLSGTRYHAREGRHWWPDRIIPR